MKRFEELYACSVLSVSGFDLFGEYRGTKSRFSLLTMRATQLNGEITKARTK